MTDRQRKILRILADPCNTITPMAPSDRGAIQAAIEEIERLKHPLDSYACQRCGRVTGLDAVLPDAKWEQVSEAAGGVNLLCLWCIDEIAASLGIEAWVSLFFAGRAIHGTSQSEADQSHIDRMCDQVEAARVEIERMGSRIGALRDALFWCGGSPSFAPEGEAHEGWKKVVAPLLQD